MDRIAGKHVETLESRRLLDATAVTFGGAKYDGAFQVQTDSDGSTVVAGIFSATADFDPSRSGESLLTSAGESDAFVAKYAADGKLIFAKRFGGGAGEIDDRHLFSPLQQTVGEVINNSGPEQKGAGEYVSNLSVGADNSIYIAGSFLGTADFDPGPGEFNIRSKGYEDIYVLKLDGAGNFIWAKTFGGEFEDTAKSLAVDANGSIFVTGRFTRSGDFNPTRTGVLTLNALGRDDIFVMQLSGAGKIVWAERFGGEEVEYDLRDSGEDIALDAEGNLYITGTFADRKVDFDPGDGEARLTSNGDTDTFLLKLTGAGKFVWASHVGGDHLDGGNDIAIAPDGSIYTAGYFSREANLDPGPGTEIFVANPSDDIQGAEMDIYLSHLRSDGSLIWARQLSGAGFEWLGRMAVQSSGDVSITGAFSGMLTLNPTAGSPTTITSVLGDTKFLENRKRKFSYDIFVASFASNGDLQQLGQFGSTSDDFGVGIATTSDSIALAGNFKGTVNFATPADPVNKRSAGLNDVFLLLDPDLQDISS
jgi:hypothetical protein